MKVSTLVAGATLLTAPALANDWKPSPPKPTPSKPAHPQKLVSSEALQKEITLEALLAGSQKLQDIATANGGNRAFGGGGHNATAEWLYQELLATGYYDVYKQPFTELFSAATVRLSVGGNSSVPAEYMTYGPSGNFTGPIVRVNNLGCDASDYPAEVSGKIALISRGTCTFGAKATTAKAAGAAAVIIYNNLPLQALSGTLGAVGTYAPTVGVTQEVGNQIIAAIAAGSAQGTVFVNTIEEQRVSYNVIAETKGGDHDNVLMIGGHSDSVYAGPGINDDGSGSIGSLVVAKALAKFKVKNAVRFGWYSAEEFGKLGSFHYLRTLNGTISGGPQEVAKIRAYLNFDMIASPNYVLGIYDGDGSAFNFSGPAGSDTIEKDFEAFYESKGKAHVPSLFTLRSDYAAFLENGIPSGGLFTGAETLKTAEEALLFGGEAGQPLDACYHKACDNIDNLDNDVYLLNTQSIANSVAKYAVDWAGIPRPGQKLRRRTADKARAVSRFDRGGHGHHGQPCGSGHTEL
ncbi:Zn-dependent exopeptidase [Dothidotthia symphoricarpi CBS 119687]|uniref:Peptide hydrolase n=1 Tax=Dothidotthia symphoricarpi CBS 119687 TaxID=1392245 RepID=A0A6A6AF64_9PLEO|nr:Zn-dependent exopeptidase [Dothidotthia symphoricarpi CBS 119687]KAF2129668.1 Zn-dependent exopeptidase [Dothidotthia symphoricarpi CBS 119687]